MQSLQELEEIVGNLETKVINTALPTSSEQLLSLLKTTILKHITNVLSSVGASNELSPNELSASIQLTQVPKNIKNADYCFSSHLLSRYLKTNPNKAALQLVDLLKTEKTLFSDVSSQAAFVNLQVSPVVYASAAIGEYILPPASSKYGTKGHLLLEFSSPNTNKPQHLGHVRNNCLGDSLSRILDFTGYRVTKINLVNDRGIHICKSMLAWQRYGNGETPESTGIKGDHLIGKYYVLFEQKFKEEYDHWINTEEAKEAFNKWPEKLVIEQKNEQLQKKADEEAKKLIEFEKNNPPTTNDPNTKQPDPKKQKVIKKPDPKPLLDKIKDPWKVFVAEYKDEYFNKYSELGLSAKKMLVLWEQGDKATLDLWSKMNEWVFNGFSQTYSKMGVSFDKIERESQTYLLGKKIVSEGLEKGIFTKKEEDGSVIFDFSKLPELKTTRQKRLLRSDGTSVYMTQDLGTACQRIDNYDSVKKLIYVVACEQDNHFTELFGILRLLRPEFREKDSLYHRSYGMVNLPSGRMKSREGTVVDADDIIEEVSLLAKIQTIIRIIEKKIKEKEKKQNNNENNNFENEKIRLEKLKNDTKQPLKDESRNQFLQRIKDEINKEITNNKFVVFSDELIKDIEIRAEKITLAAVRYYMLAAPPSSAVAFDVNKSLDFTAGKTGPYNLYMYARCKSILRKAGEINVEFKQENLHRLGTEDERNVLAALLDFGRVIEISATSYDPSKICEGVFRISKAFSGFFSRKGDDKITVHPIVNLTDKELRDARLQIVVATAAALKLGLGLLGISTLEKM